MFTVLKQSCIVQKPENLSAKICLGVLFWINKHLIIVHQQVCLPHSAHWFVIPYWNWHHLGVVAYLSVSLDHSCIVYLFECVNDMFLEGTKSKVKTDVVHYESSVKVAYCSHISGTLVAFVSMKVTVWQLGLWARYQLSACALLFDEGWASDFRLF